MPSAKDIILAQLKMGEGLIGMFTADLSDQEYFRPAADGTNHAAWILGHLACTEDWAVSALTGVDNRIPDSTRDLYRGSSKCLPDATKYASRKEIDEMFSTARARTIEALNHADEARWEDVSLDAFPKPFFATVGAVWGIQATHQFWHIGQLTTCRAAMKKKPVLFQ